MASITKRELVQRISETMDCRQFVVRDVVQAFLDEMVKELSRGNRLEFREFGIFQPIVRGPRQARNPRTGVTVSVPSRAAIHFKPGRLMREMTESMTDDVLKTIQNELAKRSRKPRKKSDKD